MQFGCIPVILSDDLVWAYSSSAGGSLEPSKFSIQLPQRIVQKSALFLLGQEDDDYEEASLGTEVVGADAGSGRSSSSSNRNSKQQVPLVSSEQDLNMGAPLPGTGTSLLALLREVAQEEREIKHRAQEKHRARQQRYHQQKQGGDFAATTATATATPAPGDAAGVELPSAFVRILQKIPAEDIYRLQMGLRNISEYFRFYRMDPNMKPDEIPISVHRKPDGGAITMLDRLLDERKLKGIVDIAKRCQVRGGQSG